MTTTNTTSNDVKQPKQLFGLINNLQLDFLHKHWAFVLWIVFFLVMYIANGHKVIKTIRKINKTNAAVTKMKYEYLIKKSEFIEITQQGKLIEIMKKNDLQELKISPIMLNDSLDNY